MLHIHLNLNERAVLVKDGRPVAALAPGRHTRWTHHDVIRWNTDELVFTGAAAVLAAVPGDWYERVHVGAAQYALVFRDEQPVKLLRPGVHRVWKVETGITVRAFAADAPLPVLNDELRRNLAKAELVEVTLELHQRAVLVRDGAPERVLGPGRHAFWGERLHLVTWNLDELVFTGAAEVLALVPPTWFTTVALEADQRAVIFRDQRPVKFLRPGLHRVWTLAPGVAVQVFAVTGAVPELTDELRAVIPAGEVVEATVRQFERGLLYVQGRFAGALEPGRHVFWNHAGAKVAINVLDTRVQQLKVEGQELMTKDKVTLRLTLTAEYAPTDAPTTVHAVADVKDALYLAVQLAAREFVAGVTLDDLLEQREALTRYLEAQVAPRAETFGLRVHRVGVKDVILPGEMKTLLNKVIEAEKAAAANVILRREDAAVTRNLANTAKTIAEHPVLMRLKELETMKEVAEKIHELKLVVGADGLHRLFAGEATAGGEAAKVRA
ncbi:MAG: slipin family protein [Kofleriaceae bacterium]|jgi:regulator of protease activity HflC (stomatin/prohibitin superfamily)|nr:slipin family protein [Kofleriaceae bacterium]MBP9166648.1 slipin family protein [Kofleriaceae bacterium]MBP9858432.1 slipin family protein [Kofleriaceae bacterium]